ncbi:MAG: hypothetical protein ACOC8E_01920 [Planctomycetota bacterium]
MPKKKLTLEEVKAEIAEVARVGQMFIEGDACRRMWTEDAQTFLCGDDMNYDADVTVPVKKNLFRLERLCRIPCSTALWRRRPDMPDRGEALLFGSTGSPEGARKPANRGYEPPEMTRELRRAFLEGKPSWKTRHNRPGAEIMIDRGLDQPTKEINGSATVQYFVPIKDSMGEIAAALEVFTVATG